MKAVIIKTIMIFSLFSASAQGDQWAGFSEGSVTSPLDGYVNRFYYYASSSGEPRPLVVSIHQWSATYANFRNSMAPQVKALDWNYIQPDVRGANNHPKACGSDYVVDDIDRAIEWAVANMPVDTARIYIVGASGGGFNALCHFMRSNKRVAGYSIWVPITNIERWYYESVSRKSRYAQDIEKCVGVKDGALNAAEARRRSPVYMETPVEKLKATRLDIYAGIHDGYTGAVPINHSVEFYNKVVREAGATAGHIVPDSTLIWMLSARTGPRETGKTLGGRDVHYYNGYANVSLTIFEGGHEILVDSILK